MFFSSYIVFLPIFHSKLSVHVAPPGFSSLILQLPLAPFPRHHPRPVQPHSRPLRPVPSLLFQLPIIMQVPDWPTSPAAGLMGRSMFFQLQSKGKGDNQTTLPHAFNRFSQHPVWKEGNSPSPPTTDQ